MSFVAPDDGRTIPPLPVMADPAAMVRVCLCDDVREFRELMRFGLEADPDIEVICEAADGERCIEVVDSATPDVVLLDLSMPDRDGLEVIEELRSRSTSTKIVVLSGFAAARMEQAVLSRGADRYLEKGTPLAEIRSAIRQVAEKNGLPQG
jgi:two-component system response regulator (stage 0 sporulation protein A)